MMIDEIEQEANGLLVQGFEILQQFLLDAAPDKLNKGRIEKSKKLKKKGYSIQQEYQKWYTKSLRLIKSIEPDRVDEFVEMYKSDSRRKEVNFRNFAIDDYFSGMVVSQYGKPLFNPDSIFSRKFQTQLLILNSVFELLSSKLRDIKGILRFEIFDDELEAANDLKKKKHYRAAGAVAGVVIERHLKSICQAHGITFRKKAPGMSDYNEALKKGELTDVPTWRFIQRMGDIRNLCVHQKEREPKEDEILDIVEGAKKILAEVF